MAPDLTKHPDIEKLSELLADFPHIRVAFRLTKSSVRMSVLP